MARPNGSSVTQNKLACANVLLSRFADVNVPNEDGDTPLIAGKRRCVYYKAGSKEIPPGCR